MGQKPELAGSPAHAEGLEGLPKPSGSLRPCGRLAVFANLRAGPHHYGKGHRVYRRFQPTAQLHFQYEPQHEGFDFVIAVIFHEDYSVRLAVKITHTAVPQLARYQAHTNGYNLILTSKAVEIDGVEDITHCLS